jgi:hypothetical protein
MKAPLAFLALAASALAQSPVVIYQPAQPMTVVSPLTNSTAQSGQALLSQINNTINQRVFEHQVLTLSAQQQQQPAFQVTRPIVISPK